LKDSFPTTFVSFFLFRPSPCSSFWKLAQWPHPRPSIPAGPVEVAGALYRSLSWRPLFSFSSVCPNGRMTFSSFKSALQTAPGRRSEATTPTNPRTFFLALFIAWFIGFVVTDLRVELYPCAPAAGALTCSRAIRDQFGFRPPGGPSTTPGGGGRGRGSRAGPSEG